MKYPGSFVFTTSIDMDLVGHEIAHRVERALSLKTILGDRHSTSHKRNRCTLVAACMYFEIGPRHHRLGLSGENVFRVFNFITDR